MDVAGKTILITGTVRGIGQRTATAFAHAGADVIGVDRPGQSHSETAAMVQGAGRRYAALEADLAEAGAAGRVIEAARAAGGFDVLVNNAGVLPSGPFLERPLEQWQRTIDINVKALLALCYESLPHLLARDQGYIVNIASVAGYFGGSGIAAYAASKHAVKGFSESLHFELEGRSVGVGWVCPSMVDTRMTEGVSRSVFIPVVRPERIAEAVVQTVRKERQSVLVPRRMYWIANFLPGLAPRFWRWFVSVNPKRHIWRDAGKPIQG